MQVMIIGQIDHDGRRRIIAFVVAGTCKDLAAEQESALLAHAVCSGLKALCGFAVDEWAHEHVARLRIANPDGARERDETLEERVMDSFVDVDLGAGAALLTLQTECR